MGFDATMQFIEEEASLPELNDLRTIINHRAIILADKKSWRVGQKVRMIKECQAKKPYDTIGEIVKVNRVKLRIDFGIHRIWLCRKTIVEAV
jgi:hypothetical protein